MKKKRLLLLFTCLAILLIGAGFLWRYQLDPKAKAIREAENYTPTGLCTGAETPAVHDKTGARYTFLSGCLPPGWSSAP